MRFCMPIVNKRMHNLHTTTTSVSSPMGAIQCFVHAINWQAEMHTLWKLSGLEVMLEKGCKHCSWQEVEESFNSQPPEAAAVLR